MSLPNDPKARKSIKDCLEQISQAMTRIEDERDYIKNAINDICEEHTLSKKTFRKLAKTFHKRNFSIEVAEHQEFETMYEELTQETVLPMSV